MLEGEQKRPFHKLRFKYLPPRSQDRPKPRGFALIGNQEVEVWVVGYPKPPENKYRVQMVHNPQVFVSVSADDIVISEETGNSQN